MSSRLNVATELLGITAYILAPIVVAAMIGLDVIRPVEVMTISADGMCCQHAVDIAATELRKIEGVRSISADLCGGKLFVTVVAPNRSPAPMIWAALNECRLNPRKMVFRDQKIGE